MTEGQEPGAAASSGPIELGIASIGPALEIGRGAAGVVYRADQPAIARAVAVKLLPFAALDEAARMRFQRECRAMGALSGHPGIVTVHETGFTSTGQPYILMELMDGGSLEDRLRVRGPLDWEEVVELGALLAGALEAAHAKGILHRDIKPDNVLISTYGAAKLGDFSIARLAGGDRTATGLVAATPAHAAPEVLRGEAPTVRSDVYSLASTLYTLLAGTAPFFRPDEATIFQLLRRIEEDPVPDLRPRGVPGLLCGVLECAMSKDPAQRPTSANQLGAELLAARDRIREEAATAEVTVPNLPVVGAGRPATAPGSTPDRRGRRLAVAAGLLVLVGGGGLAVGLGLRGGSGSLGQGTGGSSVAPPSADQGSTTASGSTAASSSDTGAPNGPPALSARILTPSDAGSQYFYSHDSVLSLGSIRPCGRMVDLSALIDESDAGFSDGKDTNVDVSVATFQPGAAQRYLDAMQAASSCPPSPDPNGSFATGPEDVTTALRLGPALGDQVVRIQALKGRDYGDEAILIRKGDVVALVNLYSPRTDVAEHFAAVEATRL